MSFLLLLPAALAAPHLESETVVQVRHDLFGSQLVPAATYLRLHQEEGPLRIEGYAGLDWTGGLHQPTDADIYLLQAGMEKGDARWTLGRQQVNAVVRPWSIDGARGAWQSGPWTLEGWAGIARHQDLDDLRDGTGVARVEGRRAKGPLRLRLGALTEAESGHDLNLHGDIEAWYQPAGVSMRPAARVLVMGGRDAPLEWGRVELGASPVPRLRATMHLQHREALDPSSMFGEAITNTFAPEGVDELGGTLRLSDASWAAWSASYALVATTEQDQRRWGHAADLAYSPGRSDSPWRVSPAWRYRSGPGGVFHALYATTTFSPSDSSQLALRTAVVPYHKLHQPWDTALSAGLQGQQSLGQVRLQLGLDVASDASYRLDVRASAALIVEGL